MDLNISNDIHIKDEQNESEEHCSTSLYCNKSNPICNLTNSCTCNVNSNPQLCQSRIYNDNDSTNHANLDISNEAMDYSNKSAANYKETKVEIPNKRLRISENENSNNEQFLNDKTYTEHNKAQNIIYNLLTKTYHGNLILGAIECDKKNKNEKSKIFNKYIYKLANIIIGNEFFNNNFDIKRERFIFLSKQICEIADDQLPEEWYIPSDGKVSAKGFLYNAYKQLRADGIQVNKFGGFIRSSNVTEPPPENLNHNYNTTNIDEVFKKYWISEIDLRKKYFKSLNISNLITLYPCLGCPSGYELILADFDYLFNAKTNNLINVWSQLSKSIIELAKLEIKNDDIKKIISDNEYLLNTIHEESLAFLILPYLLKVPKNIIHIKGLKLIDKYFADTFILQTKDFEDLEQQENLQIINERISNIYKEVQISEVKPYIVICGKIECTTAIYVILDGIHFYKIDNLITGVDLLVKINILLNGCHSKLNRHIIQFFEYYIYKTSNKALYSNVLKFSKQLNNFKT